jgi:diguanylate cyclase (GGDEF)-like protein
MLKRLFGDTLTDLGNLEGDYRFANLKGDIWQSILYMFAISISILLMLRVDASLFKNHPDLFKFMLMYRAGYMAVTMLFGMILYRTTKVRVYDRLMFGWILFTVFFRVFLNFTRPIDYPTTYFDIIFLFVIYLISPLRIQYTVVLALGFSAGTLYIDHFVKSGGDPIVLSVATSAQLTVHMLGWISVLQMQTYRRKSYQAFIDEKDAKEMVAYLANIDPLTKSLTRRHFLNIAESEFRRFSRYRRPFSVLIIDADHFKKINDTYGHHGGDLALRSLSLVAMEQKRAQDTFGRLGGEEFGLLLPETSLKQACVVAERIQKMWEQSPVNLDGELIHSTVSIGVAEAVPADTSFEVVLRRADQMLYKAKEQGRNRVVAE